MNPVGAVAPKQDVVKSGKTALRDRESTAFIKIDKKSFSVNLRMRY